MKLIFLEVKLLKIEYQGNEYSVIETQEMDDELHFKLVKFNTGYYGIISHNPITKNEKVILLSPEKEVDTEKQEYLFNGLGCKSFIVFARDAKKHLENAPIELVVQLGHDAPKEYREVITRDQAETLYQKIEICHEIMSMKLEDSFYCKYGDSLLTAFMCVTIIMFLIAIVNTLHLYGVI